MYINDGDNEHLVSQSPFSRDGTWGHSHVTCNGFNSDLPRFDISIKTNKWEVQILEFGDCCRLSVKFIPETVSDRVNLSTSCQKLSAHSIQRQLTTSKLSLVRLYRYVEPWEIWVKPITGNMWVTPCTISWKWRLRD
jgi:hypothetical protein